MAAHVIALSSRTDPDRRLAVGFSPISENLRIRA